MPFPMTHLLIAKNILEVNTKIKDEASFLLGSISPDSVHFRNNYTGEYKKISHLCIGNENWGECTNNDEWWENVLIFLNDNKDADNFDFYLGYCVHIFSDILWNISFWSPYRFDCIKKHGKLKEDDDKKWRQECNDIDYFLYNELKNDRNLWLNIETSCGIDIPQIAFAEEIHKIKINILNNQYKNRKLNDCEKNTIVELATKMRFINDSSSNIGNCIKDKI